MLDQQINEQLGLLQQELSRLKKAADYIDGARENSAIIVAELEGVQKNYTVYTDKILSLYRQYADDLKKGTEIQINDGVLKFEATGNRIDATNREKLVETKRLLEQYSRLAEATDNLVGTLETVDFPARLSGIGTAVQSVQSALEDVRQSIEDKQAENQTALLERLGRQDGDMKLLRMVLFLVCGLIIAGTVATIFALR